MKIKNTLVVMAVASIFTGCSQVSQFSQVSQVSQSLSSVTKMGSQEEKSYKASEQSSLVVPPALALPSGISRTNNYGTNNISARSTNSYQTHNPSQTSKYPRPGQGTVTNTTPARPTTLSSNKNYYVVVGTYPDSEQAMDTFVRLSSIGLPNATMESRVTKTGKSLHMVRLGPFKRQAQIDKIKDSLMSDGLTQFKVVES